MASSENSPEVCTKVIQLYNEEIESRTGSNFLRLWFLLLQKICFNRNEGSVQRLLWKFYKWSKNLWENRAQRLNYRNREKNSSIFNALALDSIICYCWFSTLTAVIDEAIEEEKCRNDKLFPWLTRPDAFLNQLFISHSLLFSISHLSFFYYLTSNSEKAMIY